MTDQWTGAGIFESYASFVKTIEGDAQSETERVLDITFGAIDVVASTVALVVDPIGTLLAAGIGWLIEHVSFLREPLDMLMGDRDAIQAHIEQVKADAKAIRDQAELHKTAMAQFTGWEGKAGEAFKQSMDRLGGELDSLAEVVDGTARVTAVTGTLIIILRDIVRDLIAGLLAQLVKGALIAAAAAVFTLGASIVGFIGYAVGAATALAVQIGARIAKLIAALGRQAARLGKLGGSMGTLGQNFSRFGDAGGIVHEGVKAGGGYGDFYGDKGNGAPQSGDQAKAAV
ncbi:WXG100 family type VII secretion target [Saccharothrix saharensis]|uniref:WXG100 family type VII secretion target n=1 Tax=Saccharothrix saharensis TaxID=571190 RepID=UPI0036B02F6F